jgi:alkylhydroperoxidase family enzyme
VTVVALWVEGSGRDEVLGLRPELAAEHARLLEAIWSGPVSPVTLELCRLRMATLLRCAPALAERSPAALAAGLDEERIARLPAWPTDPGTTDEERACIGFAEQYVIDHHGVTDEQVATLVDLLGDEGVVTFTTALVVWENQHRFDNALGVAQAGRG